MLMISGGLLTTVICLVWGVCLSPGWALDLQVYQAGGAAWAHGFPLYVAHFVQPVGGPDLPFTYPPIAAVIFSVLSMASLPAAIVVMIAVNLTALITLCLVAASRQYGWRPLALVVGLTVTGVSVLLKPVRETLWFGQVNLVLGMLVAVDQLERPFYRSAIYDNPLQYWIHHRGVEGDEAIEALRENSRNLPA